MAELLGNLGYLALKREATPGTAVIPDTYVPLYEESMRTMLNLVEDNAVFGNKFARLQVVPGQRGHGGGFTVMAEPNSTALLYDMLYTKGTVTGSDPYTWPYTADETASNSYTVDISTGNQVIRYSGVQASEIKSTWESNEMRKQVTAAALHAFSGAQIASVATTVITLETVHDDPTPSVNLVVGDSVTIWHVADDSRDTHTISAVTDTTVTVDGTPSASAGDMLVITPATPNLDLLTPFQWARTEFRFGATAAAALSATHTPVETGSEWTHLHAFEEDEGAKRSGSYDPAALVRKLADVNLVVKKFFEDPDEIKTFRGIEKQALVVRCFSGSGHELRLTFNDIRIRSGGDKPLVVHDEIEYYELEYVPVYDQTDAQAFKVEVINGLADA